MQDELRSARGCMFHNASIQSNDTYPMPRNLLQVTKCILNSGELTHVSPCDLRRDTMPRPVRRSARLLTVPRTHHATDHTSHDTRRDTTSHTLPARPAPPVNSAVRASASSARARPPRERVLRAASARARVLCTSAPLHERAPSRDRERASSVCARARPLHKRAPSARARPVLCACARPRPRRRPSRAWPHRGRSS